MKPFPENDRLFGAAIAIPVAQQHQPVRRGFARPGLVQEIAHEQAGDAARPGARG